VDGRGAALPEFALDRVTAGDQARHSAAFPEPAITSASPPARRS
jgi:hypothetical protein